MDAPRENEQATEAMDTESLLSAEFDRMAAEEEEASETITDESEESGEALETSEEQVETTEEAEVEAEAEQELAAEEQADAEESGYTEPAPERWPSELREAYDQLPPESRKLMMEQVYKPMQRQYTKTTQELAEAKRNIQPMVEALDQYRNDFERMGMNPVDAFRTQVAWAAHFARVGPQQGIADMQAAYGMNANQPGQQEPEQYLTPVERSIKAELDELKQQMGQTSQTIQQSQEQQATAQQQAIVNGVQQELQSFINEQKDGKPAHPHVEKVAPAIAGIIRGGLVSKVDDYGQPISIRDQMARAYDMACKLDPSISTASPRKEQVRRAKAAQNAGVVANTPAGQADVPSLSVSEELERTYDQMNRRTG